MAVIMAREDGLAIVLDCLPLIVLWRGIYFLPSPLRPIQPPAPHPTPLSGAPAPARIKSLSLWENVQCTAMRGDDRARGWEGGVVQQRPEIDILGVRSCRFTDSQVKGRLLGDLMQIFSEQAGLWSSGEALVYCSWGSAGGVHLCRRGPSGWAGRSRGWGDVSSPCLVTAASSEWSQRPGLVGSGSLPEGFLSASHWYTQSRDRLPRRRDSKQLIDRESEPLPSGWVSVLSAPTNSKNLDAVSQNTWFLPITINQ